MAKENVLKMQPEVRKVVEVKGSYSLNIPKKFVTHYGIKAGDSLVLIPGVEMYKVMPIWEASGD